MSLHCAGIVSPEKRIYFDHVLELYAVILKHRVNFHAFFICGISRQVKGVC